MEFIKGKTVYEDLNEILDPKHTALLIVDMQNGLASPQGYTARQGDISVAHQQSIIPNIKRLLETARLTGVRVVHIRVVSEENMAFSSPASLYAGKKMVHFGAYWGHPGKEVRKSNRAIMIDGSWESEIVDELCPISDEFVVRKYTNTAFVNTPMNQVLRSNHVESVVVTGTTTAGCVLATSFDALWNDYYTVVVKDAVADCFPERHQAGMAILGEKFDMPSSEAISNIWEANPRSRNG